MINGGQIPSTDSGVASLNLLTGALALIAGANITIDIDGNDITINAADGLVITGSNGIDIDSSTPGTNVVKLQDSIISSYLTGLSANVQTQLNNLTSGYNSFSVVAVATANKTISSPGSTNWDGITPANGDVVFLLPVASGGSQITASEGGVYTYNGAASPLTRVSGMSSWSGVTGSRVCIDVGGPLFQNTVWLNTNSNGGTIGVTAITYLQNFNNYIAGANLQLIGNVFSAPGEVFSIDGNTPNSLVARDPFGELEANYANAATFASGMVVAPDTTSTLSYPVFVSNLGPGVESARTNNDFNYNAVTNTLTVNLNAPSGVTVPNTLTLGYGGSLLTVDSAGKIIASDFINNVNGYRLSWASNTTLGLSAGTCSLSGSGLMMSQAGNVVINIANVGVVNGLDTGTAANNTSYYVYAIFHTNPALNGGIISTNSTTPTLPSGYIASRYVGRVRRGSGSFIPFIQTGTGTTRKITYTGATILTKFVSAGASNIFASASMANFVPPGARVGKISYSIGNAVTNLSGIYIRETGSSVTQGSGLIYDNSGAVISNGIYGIIDFVCNTSQSIDYALDEIGTVVDLCVFSYEYDL